MQPPSSYSVILNPVPFSSTNSFHSLSLLVLPLVLAALSSYLGRNYNIAHIRLVYPPPIKRGDVMSIFSPQRHMSGVYSAGRAHLVSGVKDVLDWAWCYSTGPPYTPQMNESCNFLTQGFRRVYTLDVASWTRIAHESDNQLYESEMFSTKENLDDNLLIATCI